MINLQILKYHFRFYGHHSPEGKVALDLRKSYFKAKMDYFDDLESAIENEYPLIYFRKKLESKSESQEDVIECPCGQFKEEGTMIQCEKCQIWQHLDCVESPPEDPETPYFCCKCSNVKPSLDIKLVPQPEHYPGIVFMPYSQMTFMAN